jgi:hypothetical protein
MSMSMVRMPSTPPVVSREVTNTRGAARWQLPLYRQPSQPRAYTPEELADMYAVRHDSDMPSNAAFSLADAIAFCDACGEEVPYSHGPLDNCPHCGW